MTTDEKGNPLTYWGGLEKAIKNTLEEAIENKIKGINVDTGFRIERSYSEEEVFILLSKMADTIFRVPKMFTNSREWFEKHKKK